MNILITGASGFLGRNFKEKALANKIFSISNSSKYIKIKNDYFFDLTNKSHVSLFISSTGKEKIDFLFHFAAITPFNNRHDFKKDIEISKNIRKICLALKIPFLAFSSGWVVYSQNDKKPFRENSSLYPNTEYGRSKLKTEKYFKKNLSNTTFICLRLATVFGPGQTSSGFIPNLTKSAIQTKKITVYNPDLEKDYMFIDNLIAALNNLLKVKINKKIDMNVGSGRTYKIIDIARKVQQIFKENFNEDITIEIKDYSSKDNNCNYMDISRSLKVLGDYNKVNVEKGLKEYVYWAKLVNA